MNTVREAIEAAITRREDEIGRLRQMLALAEPEAVTGPRTEVYTFPSAHDMALGGAVPNVNVTITGSADALRTEAAKAASALRAVEPKSPRVVPPKPKPAPRSTSGRDGLPAVAQRALEFIRSRGDVSPGEIGAELGITETQQTKALTRLRDRGLVEAIGSTRNRRYRATSGTTEHGERTEAGKETSAARTATKIGQVAFRQRVLTAILSNPGALTEERLGAALNAGREEIADACGRLLLDDKVVLNPDGTYGRTARSAA